MRTLTLRGWNDWLLLMMVMCSVDDVSGRCVLWLTEQVRRNLTVGMRFDVDRDFTCTNVNIVVTSHKPCLPLNSYSVVTQKIRVMYGLLVWMWTCQIGP